MRVSAEEGEMEGGKEKEVFVYRDKRKGNCGVLNDHLTNIVTVNRYNITTCVNMKLEALIKLPRILKQQSLSLS